MEKEKQKGQFEIENVSAVKPPIWQFGLTQGLVLIFVYVGIHLEV